MKLLFIGDIVGEPGRKAVQVLLPRLRDRLGIQFVVANGENSAGGSGITPRIAEELFESGVHVITTGDHLWDQKEVVTLLETESRFLRPANYPSGVSGYGSGVYELDGLPPVGVINLQGRTFMPDLENPFRHAEIEVNRLRERTPIIFVDFHAEATSEKIAMGRMLDGRISALVGTHTHVQTADEQLFPGGTAYLTDAGFTGPQASVLGREIEPVLRRFLLNTPQRFLVAREDVRLHGALIEIDEASGSARSITRVAERLENT
ncbi:MAG TPA: TIGR00282 family metallophosphoesterase [Verrucomicrobiales bacterium]|nr:TIGR00282 family metallophosphoesterase [Verrucomicrobiales bacterium]